MKSSYINTQKESDPTEYPNSKEKKSDKEVYQYKIIILGDISVGKTSILRRFIENEFSSEYICTVGVEFRIKSIMINNKLGADLKIWDTCGEEKYRTITRQYYRDSNGVLLVFDLSSAASFEKLQDWYEDITNNGPRDLYILLVGNKKDIVDREVTIESIKSFLGDHPGIDYIETSALSGEGVSDAFRIIADKLIKNSLETEKKGVVDEEKKDPSITLKERRIKGETIKKKGVCC